MFRTLTSNKTHATIEGEIKYGCEYRKERDNRRLSLTPVPAFNPEQHHGDSAINNNRSKGSRTNQHSKSVMHVKSQQITTTKKRPHTQQHCKKKRKSKKSQLCPIRKELAMPKKQRLFMTWKDYAHVLPVERILLIQKMLNPDECKDNDCVNEYFQREDCRRKKKWLEKRKRHLNRCRLLVNKHKRWIDEQIHVMSKLLIDHLRAFKLAPTLSVQEKLMADLIVESLKAQGHLDKKVARLCRNSHDEALFKIVDQLSAWINDIVRYVDFQQFEAYEHVDDDDSTQSTLSSSLHSSRTYPSLSTMSSATFLVSQISSSLLSLGSIPSSMSVPSSISSALSIQPIFLKTVSSANVIQDVGSGSRFGSAKLAYIYKTQSDRAVVDLPKGEDDGRRPSGKLSAEHDDLIRILSKSEFDKLAEVIDANQMPDVTYGDVLNQIKAMTDEDVAEAEALHALAIEAGENQQEDAALMRHSQQKDFYQKNLTDWVEQNEPGSLDSNQALQHEIEMAANVLAYQQERGGDGEDGAASRRSGAGGADGTGGAGGAAGAGGAGGESDGKTGGKAGTGAAEVGSKRASQAGAEDEAATHRKPSGQGEDGLEDGTDDEDESLTESEREQQAKAEKEQQDKMHQLEAEIASAGRMKGEAADDDANDAVASAFVHELGEEGASYKEIDKLKAEMGAMEPEEIEGTFIPILAPEEIPGISVERPLAKGMARVDQPSVFLPDTAIPTIIFTHHPSTLIEHTPDRVCCLTLRNWSTWLIETANTMHMWSIQLTDLVAQIRRQSAILKGEVSDCGGRTVRFSTHDWRELAQRITYTATAWQQCSQHIADMCENILQHENALVTCCHKCLNERLITDDPETLALRDRLIGAVRTTARWRTWLNEIVDETQRLVGAAPSADVELPDAATYGRTLHIVTSTIDSQTSVISIDQLN